MADSVRTSIVLATVLATVVACSSHGSPSTAKSEFRTAAGQPLTIAPGRMLAATGGATPVAFGKPAHGKISYGDNGSMVYAPDRGFTGTDHLDVTVSRAVQVYAEDQLPLATMGGVTIKASAHGSSIAAVPGSADEIYGLTDRGPNVDGRGPGEKVLPLPDYHPQIVRLKLSAGVATVQRTIPLQASDGVPLVGLIDPHASTGESLVDLDGVPLPPSDYGVDPEGLAVTRDGTFWVSEEYGPYIIHFDANGKELERLSPFDDTLPRELSLRTPNQGLEGLTLTPDGNTLVGVMQSAIQTPGLSGSARDVPVTRIVTVNLVDRSIVHEYLYPLANPRESKVGVSEITALSATTFLIDEGDSKPAPKASKKIYFVDVATATDVGPRATVPGAAYQADAGGLLIDRVPIETLIGAGTDTDAVAKLKSVGIAVATKTLKLDLGALVRSLSGDGDFFGHSKVEGLFTRDGGNTLVIANDSDFGLAGIASDAPPFRLKPKVLPNGTQDSGEFLIVDTTKPTATTETVQVSFRVG